MKRRQSGLTLTELMVAILVGSFATLAVVQSFAVSEEQRRSATSGGDATFNGLISMSSIQQDVRMAGFGINASGLLGCAVQVYDEGISPPRTYSWTMAPILITQGVGTAPDRITVTYSSSDTLPTPINIIQNMPNPAANYKVNNAFGVDAGDLLVAVEAGKGCTLAQATNTPNLASNGPKDLIIHNSGNYTDSNGVVRPARYNRPGGFGPTYTTAGSLINLGQGPTVNEYYINNNTLMVDRTLINQIGAELAPNIVQLQAQYGVDTDGNGTADSWTEVTPTTEAGWLNAVAVRIALVARSALAERPNPTTGACETTTTLPRWTEAGMNLDVSGDPNWRCYRYRVFTTTTSLRNLIWRPT